MPGHVEFQFSFAGDTDQPSRRGESLRILMIGDFRGAARPAADDSGAAPLVVDIDNFEQRLRAMAPAADATDARGNTHRIVFDSLESFHPDELFRRVNAFDTPTAPTRTPTSDTPAAPAQDSPEEQDEDDFARLLGQSPDEPARTPTQGMLDSFIKNIVSDDVVADDGHAKARVAGTESSHAEQLRALLHSPGVQRLEATWRSLYDLISELETGEELSVHMLDVGTEALRADLDAVDYKECALFRRLVTDDHGRFGGQAWHLIACDTNLDGGDTRRLGNLGAVAAAAGGVVLADAGALVDAEASGDGLSFADLRGLPVAQHIGVLAPRVLMRLPYGPKSDPVDSFDFAECAGRPEPEELLWGSAAVLLARRIGQEFLAKGWRMSPGAQLTIGDRPAYVFEEDGERRLANVTRAPLSDSEAEALLATGVMAVLGERDGNRLLLPRVQSIAEPASSLRGAWS